MAAAGCVKGECRCKGGTTAWRSGQDSYVVSSVLHLHLASQSSLASDRPRTVRLPCVLLCAFVVHTLTAREQQNAGSDLRAQARVVALAHAQLMRSQAS